MQTSKYINRLLLIPVIAVSISFSSCKKKEISYEYGVNPEAVLPNNIEKTHLKTTDQFVAILYTNLFQKSLSASQLFQISQCFDSVGDQILARQLIIANFLGKSGVILPTDAQMKADIPKFIEETFIKFYIRKPTEAEKTYLTQMITSDPKITAELVYFSFALSDEYMYY
jgi:hypothetical protein